MKTMILILARVWPFKKKEAGLIRIPNLEWGKPFIDEAPKTRPSAYGWKASKYVFWVKTLGILALLPIALLLSCGATDTPGATRTEQPSSGSETPTVAPVSTPTLTAPPGNLSIGDSATIDDVTFTVHSVRWGESYDPPPAGMGTLAIDISIVNNKDETFGVSRVLMFGLVDKDGRNQEMTNVTDGPDDMNGDLAAGRRMRGEVPFTVSKADASWDLVIQPDILEDDQAIFTIPAPK